MGVLVQGGNDAAETKTKTKLKMRVMVDFIFVQKLTEVYTIDISIFD